MAWSAEERRYACRVAVVAMAERSLLPDPVREFLVASLSALSLSDPDATGRDAFALKGRQTKAGFSAKEFVETLLAAPAAPYSVAEADDAVVTIERSGNELVLKPLDLIAQILGDGPDCARFVCELVGGILRRHLPMPVPFDKWLAGALNQIALGADPDDALRTKRKRGRQPNPILAARRAQIAAIFSDANRPAIYGERAVSLIEQTLNELSGARTVRKTTKGVRQAVRRATGAPPGKPGRPKKKT